MSRVTNLARRWWQRPNWIRYIVTGDPNVRVELDKRLLTTRERDELLNRS